MTGVDSKILTKLSEIRMTPIRAGKRNPLLRVIAILRQRHSIWCGRRDSNPHDVAIEGF